MLAEPRLAGVSVRVYGGPHSDRGHGPVGWVARIPWILAALTIGGQILWIVVGRDARTTLTVLTVVTFFLTTATHAWLRRGSSWALSYVAITVGFGFVVEVIGLATSFPFGTYEYSGRLGPAVAGVPLVIPLAWSMMAYPCLLAAQRLSTTTMGTALLGGWLLASWDLFLDPQMVGEGYWAWQDATWHLPGIDAIPLQNFLGWLLAAMVLMALLDLLPRKTAPDAVPTTMLTWVYASSTLANLVFLSRPGVAIWGAVCMGLVLVPYLWRSWSQPTW